MRVLVIGGAGFIGSHVVEYYQGKAEVRVLDSLRTGRLENLKAFKAEFIKGDIRDREIVRKAVQDVDYIFLMAAMISVPESMDNPVECVDINCKGTLIVLEEAAKAGVKKLCFSSSCAVYGDNPESPKIETMIPEPKSPYAVSKLDGEFYCGIFANENRLKTACMRYFNVFGPRQDPGSAYAAAIPIFTSKAVRNETISVYGDGFQTRDFVYVKDVVAVNVFLAENDKYIGVYNVGYGRQTSVNDLISNILKQTNSNSRIEYLSERAGDIKHSLGCIDKLLSTGYKYKFDFNEGLKNTISYFETVQKTS